MKDATEGIVVIGNPNDKRNSEQVWKSQGVVVDQRGNVYITDSKNDRIMCWSNGSTESSIVVGSNEPGKQLNQFDVPVGSIFDRQNNLYVADSCNHRIQKFILQ